MVIKAAPTPTPACPRQVRDTTDPSDQHGSKSPLLTGASPSAGRSGIESDRVFRIFRVRINVSLLCQSRLASRLESLIYVYGLLRRGLEIGYTAFRLTPRHRPFLRHHPLAFLDIDLVTEDDEGEVVRIPRTGLDEEFVSPRVERFETLTRVDVVDQDAAIRSSIESDTERLEPLLTGGIPQLKRDQSIVDHDLLRQEIGPDGSLVLVRETLVDKLVHERRLPDSAISQNDDLEQDLLP